MCYIVDVRHRRGEATTVRNASRSYDHHGLSGEGALCVLAKVDAGRNQNGERRVAGVASTLSTLRTDDVNPWGSSG